LRGFVAQAAFADHSRTPHCCISGRVKRSMRSLVCADAKAARSPRMRGALLHDFFQFGAVWIHRVAREVEARLAPAVEHVNLRRVADAEQRAFKLTLSSMRSLRTPPRQRRGEVVVCHSIKQL